MVGEFLCGFCRRSVDAQPSDGGLAVTIDTRAEGDLALHALDLGEDGEAGTGADTADVGKNGPAKTPSGREEGYRFEKVRLARAVLAGQHYMPAIERQCRFGIIAEVGELETGEECFLRHGNPVVWQRS